MFETADHRGIKLHIGRKVKGLAWLAIQHGSRCRQTLKLWSEIAADEEVLQGLVAVPGHSGCVSKCPVADRRCSGGGHFAAVPRAQNSCYSVAGQPVGEPGTAIAELVLAGIVHSQHERTGGSTWPGSSATGWSGWPGSTPATGRRPRPLGSPCEVSVGCAGSTELRHPMDACSAGGGKPVRVAGSDEPSEGRNRHIPRVPRARQVRALDVSPLGN